MILLHHDSIRVNALHGHFVVICLVYVVIYFSHLPSADVTGVKRLNVPSL